MLNEDSFTDSTTQVGEKILESISQEYRNSWQILIESTNMSKNSKKAWSAIRKLYGDPRALVQQPEATANQVATQLLLNSKNGKMRHQSKLNLRKYSRNPDYTRPLSMEELEVCLSLLKASTWLWYKKWLLQLYNYCLSTHMHQKSGRKHMLWLC